MSASIFEGLTAWFSSSVSDRTKTKWINGGGREEDLDKAEYIFSEDVTAEDTSRIFETAAYLDEHLSVFHSNYISQCVKVGNVHQVALGKYLLPPKDVQDIARKQIQFQWEVDGNGQDSQVHMDDETNIASGSHHHNQQSKPSSPRKQKSSTAPSQQVPQHHNQRSPSKQKSSTAPVRPESQQNIAVAGPSGVNVTRDKDSGNQVHNETDKSRAEISKEGQSGQEKTDVHDVCVTKGNQVHNETDKSRAEISKEGQSGQEKTDVHDVCVTKGIQFSQEKRTNREAITPVTKASTVKSPRHSAVGQKRRSSEGREQEVDMTKGRPSRQSRKSVEESRDRTEMRKSNQALADSSDEWLRLEDLAKVTGVLTDFVVGTNGCEVSRKMKH